MNREMDSMDREQRIAYLKEKNIIPQNALYNYTIREMTPKQKMMNIYEALMKDDYVDLFQEVVKKENMPEYYEVIKEPMSFSMIKKRLERNLYLSIDDMEKDIMLIVNNAKKYNNSLTIFHKKAVVLEQVFKDLRQRLFDN